ncbi:proton-conducting transporter transmembrane domain-containing protein [Metallosphaera cuprina]|uniref:NADH dehydrogenase (Quinone) n=1 Tax=Metallosphaera cuprina (strain Ar-4) TaxID=1006006 RepID=F4FZR1_METCR|nr:proton-conducting transporter membrane subunit [Metallosphaera cuprina]AEB94490.1 NADH dehydrogenase (quinone) [Metallosphaera cuprina Ar-4]
MLGIYIMIISLVVSSLVFFIKGKQSSAVLSGVAIAINAYFLARRGLFEEFHVANTIGSFGLTVTDLNFAFLVTILAVTILTVPYSLRYMDERFRELGSGNWGLFFGLYSLFSVAMLYTVLSTNLLEIYIFLEIALVTSFLLIMLYGYGDRRRISLLYFIWTHVGTVLLLASIIIIGLETGTMDVFTALNKFHDYSLIGYGAAVFLVAVIGMMVKAAQAGVNVWLPYAHGEAPTPISVLLSPNMVGLGVFVIIIYFYLFPGMQFLAPIFLGWAILTMIYGGINALAQRDFKRFLAYSSVSQMGYMLLGAAVAYFMGLPTTLLALPLGVIASILIYVSHGLGKALLFMSAGANITEAHQRDIDKIGGLYQTSPLHSTLSFLGLLNILGLPPTIGLISEVLLLLSVGEIVSKTGLSWFLLVAAGLFIAIGLSSAYATYLFKKVYAGRPQHPISLDKIVEYSLPMILLSVLSLVFFFYPQIIVNSLSNFVVGVIGGDFSLPLIVFLPAIGSLIALVTPSRLNRDVRGWILNVVLGTSMVLAWLNLANSVTESRTFFIPTEFFTFSYFSFSSSLLQSILAVFVSTLSFFIGVYSVGYMREDNVLRRYWGFFGFFVSSMLAVVLSNNVLMFLAGWEGTSLASYGLISYWLDDNEKNLVGDKGRFVLNVEFISKPTTSGIRAMIFTRVGDVGLLLGLGFLLYLTTGSTLSGSTLLYTSLTNLPGMFQLLGEMGSLPFGLAMLLLLFLGGISKSAQFPFTQWLVTAMTGPTPVSALIHAATMVNLGAMLTFLAYPFLFFNVNGHSAGNLLLFFSIMAGVSLFTALYTSFNALVSNEQKVVLANSTADQISLMILASSLGGILSIVYSTPILLFSGIAIGLIQMIAHGVYKASLFMNAGSVIHYTESRYMASSPRLYKEIPWVFILQLIAALNLANVPPLLGFWAHSFISSLTAPNVVLNTIYLFLEFLGAIYIIRYVMKTFLWKSSTEETERGHISPEMLVSPTVLILASIGLGLGVTSIAAFMESHFLATGFSFDPVEFILSLLGIALAVFSYLSPRDFSKYSSFKPFISFFYYGWYIYPALDRFGMALYKGSTGVYNALEYGVIDKGLNFKLPSVLVSAGNKYFKDIQTGLLRDYVGLYVGGLILLMVIVLVMLGVI